MADQHYLTCFLTLIGHSDETERPLICRPPVSIFIGGPPFLMNGYNSVAGFILISRTVESGPLVSESYRVMVRKPGYRVLHARPERPTHSTTLIL